MPQPKEEELYYIMLVVDNDGDVNIVPSKEQFNLVEALSILELAQHKLVALYYAQVVQRKQQRPENKILIPDGVNIKGL